MLRNANKIRAVLFDAVGTLIYAEPSVVDVYAHYGQKFGSRVRADDVGTRLRDAMDAFGDDEDLSTNEQRERDRWRSVVSSVFADVAVGQAELFEGLWNHFADPGHWRVFVDVERTWRYLQANKIRIGIASNFDARLRPICESLSPLSDCQDLFCSSEIGHAKPSRHFFEAAQWELQLPGNTILMVGDDLQNDVDAPHSVGWSALLIDRDAPTDGRVLTSLEQLCDLLA